jgi:phosphotransferase system IIA component
MTSISYRAFSDAATGQTIYVNPYAVRFILPAGHRTTIVFSETHAVTVTADLQSVIESGLFQIG